MKNHWAIAIGINQYQRFQPLSYAKQDAEGLHNFLVNEIGFFSEQCLLFTDTSPPVLGKSTYPNRENLQEWLNQIPKNNLQPGDIFWFFFSGYGVSTSAEDYLMPVDGNPDLLNETGISIQSLFTSLKAFPTDNHIVLLDMNRSQGIRTGETIGTQTMDLAKKLGIPTILSCQPSQFSRETSTLQHGFFTAALLEGLRSRRCQTWEKLDNYLSDRLPQLCEQHWRPRQEPFIIFPLEKATQEILPSQEIAAETINNIVPSLTTPALVNSAQNLPYSAISETASTNGVVPANVISDQNLVTSPPSMNGNGAIKKVTFTENPPPLQQSPPLPKPPAKTTGKLVISQWLQSLLWGGVAALAMVGILMFLEQGRWFSGMRKSDPGLVSDSTLIKPNNSAQPLTTNSEANNKLNQVPANQNLLDAARMQLHKNPASKFSDAIKQARAVKSSDPLYQQAQQDIDRWSRVILDIAEGRAQQGNFEQAISAALLVSDDRGKIYQDAQQKITQWQQKIQNHQDHKKLLEKAKELAQGDSASAYSDAIFQARKIPPNDSQYKQAQKNINIWSQNILDIAKTRALEGKVPAAIAAAKLVPDDQPVLYKEAQILINNWQKTSQPEVNQKILQQAKKLAKGEQASAYNQAIALVSKITNGAEYNEAQQLVNQWSAKILELAQARADKKQYKQAIQAASLVPEKTPTYAAAKKAIIEWQKQILP